MIVLHSLRGFNVQSAGDYNCALGGCVSEPSPSNRREPVLASPDVVPVGRGRHRWSTPENWKIPILLTILGHQNLGQNIGPFHPLNWAVMMWLGLFLSF